MKSLCGYDVSPDQVIAAGGRENPWAIRNPVDEARDLHRMVTYGSCTIEGIRDLISVPPEIESALLAYANRFPKDGERIHCVLQFRRKVAREFERLVSCEMSFMEASPSRTDEGISESGGGPDAVRFSG
jgi:hypothetical protein